MKKRISIIIINCFVIAGLSAQGIDFFKGTWKEALALAEKEGKLLFVDAYATWCGPCKRMSKEVFTKKDVGDFYNENFINLKLDMEKTDGMSFGAQYPVSGYPTLLFLNGKGELVKKHTGGQSAVAFINLGLSAMRSNDTSGDYEVEYEKGNRDFDLVYNYVKALNKVGKPSLKISNEYIASDPDITIAQKAAFLLEAVVSADSKLYDELMQLKQEAVRGASEEKFVSVVQAAVLKTLKKAVEYDYPALYDMAIEKLEAAELDTEDRMKLEAEMEYNKLTGRFDDWKKLSDKYLKKYGKKDPSLYTTQIAIIKNDFSHAPAAADYAVELAREMVKKEDSLDNYYICVDLFMNQKRFDEALEYAREAIKKGEKRGESTDNFKRMADYLEKQ